MNGEDAETAVLVAARGHARGNRVEIASSDVCGCFYCVTTFRAGEVESWTGDGTAICPRCGVDAVIGSASGHAVIRSFLAKMYEHWFAGC